MSNNVKHIHHYYIISNVLNKHRLPVLQAFMKAFKDLDLDWKKNEIYYLFAGLTDKDFMADMVKNGTFNKMADTIGAIIDCMQADIDRTDRYLIIDYVLNRLTGHLKRLYNI